MRRRRSSRPTRPTWPSPSSWPPPATTCASRSTRRACSSRCWRAASCRPRSTTRWPTRAPPGRPRPRCSTRCSTSRASRPGVVEPQMQDFQLQPLLNRIENELAPQADAKGIVYRSRETHAAVRSDPALVALILRNLVSNAIRYTDSGGVLVACRARRRELLLEVWDTGIGIAPTQHQRDLSRVPSARQRRARPAQGPGAGPGHRAGPGARAGPRAVAGVGARARQRVQAGAADGAGGRGQRRPGGGGRRMRACSTCGCW